MLKDNTALHQYSILISENLPILKFWSLFTNGLIANSKFYIQNVVILSFDIVRCLFYWREDPAEWGCLTQTRRIMIENFLKDPMADCHRLMRYVLLQETWIFYKMEEVYWMVTTDLSWGGIILINVHRKPVTCNLGIVHLTVYHQSRPTPILVRNQMVWCLHY